ncbi:MAG: hypothetical protein A2537_03605 [Candidatus Magasanikbacteria bacterium RIFOXYD2_FULL_36_9]|uniref:Uncharacterized protein n=1 Tax=Candidatus Magasanikbacteria bacterium RIFOXYD2_FULL_36_9 TaxID=1798707 RepID=A0A1F6P1T7_9BACT|nr:MAG: hypothetical protein A2537_03605 [Candidatus Magasanikbacteria bacterium RIFOXYD2_FULL_36_9]
MEFQNIKNIIGIIAVLLTFVGYAPYVSDLLKGKTRPHIFSWLIWVISTSIIYALQVSAGAGLGSLVTLTVAIISLFIFIIGFKNGKKDIKIVDVLFLVLALLAIPLWLIVKQPVLSIILLSAIDMLGFAPTVRKSWNDPYSETLSFYIITTFRHGLSVVALAQYNIITVLFPVSWVVANALFSVVLIIRRKHFSKLS